MDNLGNDKITHDLIKASLTLPAPAKLNLFLHITGRRQDGYHLLQTVFQFLDYGDEITLNLRNDAHIVRQTEVEGVPAEHDLMVKAAKLLANQTKCNKGVDIRIQKNLPMGGGLGGGSSDAATLLLGLNQLWQCGLSVQQLAELGLQLGADIPVFIHGHTAWAEGVGEQIQAITIPEPWYIVIHPQVFVSTAEIFADKQLTRNCEPITIAAFFDQGNKNTVNVFEPLVRERYPEVDNALNWLNQYSKAKLTGSGSCIFAAFDDQEKAKSVLNKLPPQWKGFIAKGINISPLQKKLGAV